MHRRIAVALAATSLLAVSARGAEPRQAPPSGTMMPSKPMMDGAEYVVTLTGSWTAAHHPLEYPAGSAHFSGLIGASHDGGYAIVKEGAMPTPGLEMLSEQGKHTPLDAEINAAIAAGHAGMLFESAPVKDFSKSVTTRVRVTEKFPMVSAVAMIAPSPDWFAGAPDVSLKENGAWVKEKTVTLYAWDSGGDDGTTYKAADMDTSPKKPTSKAMTAHFVANGKRVAVGTLTFTKQ